MRRQSLWALSLTALLACASGETANEDDEGDGSGGGAVTSANTGGFGGMTSGMGGDGAAGVGGFGGGTGGMGAAGGMGGAGGSGDQTPPTVVSIDPADMATAVLSDTNVAIQFDEPMDEAAVEAAMVVTDLGAVTYSWNGAGDTLTIDPDVDLAYAQDVNPPTVAALTYALTVGTGATDLAGNPLAMAFNSSFDTARRSRKTSASISRCPGRFAPMATPTRAPTRTFALGTAARCPTRSTRGFSRSIWLG